MIFSNANTFSWVMLGASLAYDDITGDDKLSAIYFDAQSFTVGFSSVLGTTRAFLVCHGISIVLNGECLNVS